MSAAMGDSKCNDIQPLLPAYALGALESDEQSRVDDHLATCPTCRAEAASYSHVVDSLGAAAPQESPPPALKARVLAAATGDSIPEADAVAAGSDKGLTEESGSTWRESRLVYLLSAAAILLFVGFVMLALVLERTIDDRDEAVAAQEQMASYFGAGGEVVAMTSLDAANWGSWQGQGKLLSAPDKPTMVIVDGCPPTSDERYYRVWVAIDGDRTGLGEIEVDDNGTGWMEIHAPEALNNYDELGITVITNGDNREDMMVTRV